MADLKVIIRLNGQQEHVIEQALARPSLGVRTLSELFALALRDYVARHPESLEPTRGRSDDRRDH